MTAAGVCRACNKPISAARLEAKPKAAYCIECQEGREAETPIVRRGAHDSSGVILVAGEEFEPAELG